MKDRLAGKYNSIYGREYKMAEIILKEFQGEFEWSKNDYEAFRFTAKDFRLIFYPHRTSAWNHHIRVRGVGDKEKLELAFALLRVGVGYWCTFSVKNYNNDRYSDEISRKRKLKFGWAYDLVRNGGR